MARLLFPLIVVLLAVAVFYFKPRQSSFALNFLKKWLPSQKSCLSANETLFTAEVLQQYDGRDAEKGVYLSFLGIVYDVTRGIKHYGPGGTYSVFAGRDASRAFVTGNFDVDQVQDDVTDLDTAAFSGIREWAQFYQKDYGAIGRLVGSYYDPSGCPTSKWEKVQATFKELDRQAAEKKRDDAKYPPCNSEWSQDTKVTRFWCTDMSGGVQRAWTGVPRALFSPDSGSRCACVQSRDEQDAEPSIRYADDDDADPLLRQYDGCPAAATQCLVPDPH